MSKGKRRIDRFGIVISKPTEDQVSLTRFLEDQKTHTHKCIEDPPKQITSSDLVGGFKPFEQYA